jgi:hypothetical protein
LYSVIINSNSDLIPDILDMFHQFLFHTLLLEGKVPRIASPGVAKLLRGSAADPLPNFGRDLATLQRVVGDLCEEKISDAQMRSLCKLPVPDDNPRPDVNFGGVIAHTIVAFVNQSLKRFPLIKITPLLQRGIDHLQPYDFAIEKGIRAGCQYFLYTYFF